MLDIHGSSIHHLPKRSQILGLLCLLANHRQSASTPLNGFRLSLPKLITCPKHAPEALVASNSERSGDTDVCLVPLSAALPRFSHISATDSDCPPFPVCGGRLRVNALAKRLAHVESYASLEGACHLGAPKARISSLLLPLIMLPWVLLLSLGKALICQRNLNLPDPMAQSKGSILWGHPLTLNVGLIPFFIFVIDLDINQRQFVRPLPLC